MNKLFLNLKHVIVKDSGTEESLSAGKGVQNVYFMKKFINYTPNIKILQYDPGTYPLQVHKLYAVHHNITV